MIQSKLNPEVSKEFYQALRTANTKKELEHIRSGKLSAGKLGSPLLEQILYVLGVPAKPIDDYALGLFRRGNDVEDTACELLQPDEVQKEVYYRDVIGIVDAIRNEMIYEIKSIKNSQVPYINPESREQTWQGKNKYTGVKPANALQAVHNALAMGHEYVTVLYVAADDLRPYAHVIRVADVKDDVDKAIDAFEAQMALKTLPKFEALEPWQANAKYSNYPDWISLDPETAMEKLKLQYKDAYKKLMNGGK